MWRKIKLKRRIKMALTEKQEDQLRKVIDKYPPKNGKKNRTPDEWVIIAEELARLNGEFIKLNNSKKEVKNDKKEK